MTIVLRLCPNVSQTLAGLAGAECSFDVLKKEALHLMGGHEEPRSSTCVE